VNDDRNINEIRRGLARRISEVTESVLTAAQNLRAM
jgi:hypothetical protein